MQETHHSMSTFVIELADTEASSLFIKFIKTLGFVKKIQAVSTDELDNRILRLSKSIKTSGVSEEEILYETKKVRKGKHA